MSQEQLADSVDRGRLLQTFLDLLDTAGVMGSITYWPPTSTYLTITFQGRKAHAGVEPEKGINAVKVAAEAVAAMQLGRIDEETVANIGTIVGGEARNIVPGTVVLEGMARSHDQGKLDRQLESSVGLGVVPRKSGGGTDGNFFNAKGIPCVALPTGMVDEHATTEHIATEDMVTACRVLVAIATQTPEEER